MFAKVGYRAMDLPTVLHIKYCMVSVHQANLSECEGRKNFLIDAIFCSSLSPLYGTPP